MYLNHPAIRVLYNTGSCTHKATAYTFVHRDIQNLTFVHTETLVYTQNTQSSTLVYTHTHTLLDQHYIN